MNYQRHLWDADNLNINIEPIITTGKPNLFAHPILNHIVKFPKVLDLHVTKLKKIGAVFERNFKEQNINFRVEVFAVDRF